MFGFSTIGSILRLGPKEFVRQRFKLPIIKFIHDTIDLYKIRTKSGVNNIREVLFKGAVVALITALLVWLSIFMYAAFYYVYVPTISHEKPVYLKFKPCGETDSCNTSKGICSFPSAHVQLTKRQQLLMFGQPYKIYLDLDMPESPTNRELGMFMVCVEFMGKSRRLITSSCRSTMLHYRGVLIDTLYKLLYSPFFIVFGTAEEKQTVQVELFSDYEEQEDESVTDIFIEIQTRHIEIYSAKFSINAQFSGIRYVMFHWPVISAAIGITANLFFVAVVCILSWYQIINSEEYLQYLEQYNEKEAVTSGEYDSDQLNALVAVGTLSMIPLYLGYDSISYFASKFSWLLPLGTIRYIINTISNFYIDAYNGHSHITAKSDVICTNCNKIVCAKHRKSGCEECLVNNSNSSSFDLDDPPSVEEKTVRRRRPSEHESIENL